MANVVILVLGNHVLIAVQRPPLLVDTIIPLLVAAKIVSPVIANAIISEPLKVVSTTVQFIPLLVDKNKLSYVPAKMFDPLIATELIIVSAVVPIFTGVQRPPLLVD